MVTIPVVTIPILQGQCHHFALDKSLTVPTDIPLSQGLRSSARAVCHVHWCFSFCLPPHRGLISTPCVPSLHSDGGNAIAYFRMKTKKTDSSSEEWLKTPQFYTVLIRPERSDRKPIARLRNLWEKYPRKAHWFLMHEWKPSGFCRDAGAIALITAQTRPG